MDLLLLSSSRDARGGYLTHAIDELTRSLAAAGTALFIPFAGVTVSWDDYANRVREALAPIGIDVESAHEVADSIGAMQRTGAVIVGGGNTFHLLRELHRTGLLDAIGRRVREGLPYVGWSAGSVVAGPTIRTTNDMPIVEPQSPNGFGFVPFHINGHFTDATLPNHQGETREQRLTEFLTVNPGDSVLGLREGAMLRVEGSSATLLGAPGAVLFAANRARIELMPGARLDVLLADPLAVLPGAV